MRKTFKIHKDWRFIEDDVQVPQSIGVSDKEWSEIEIPHDWCIKRLLLFREAEIQLSLNKLTDKPKASYAYA